MEIRLDDVSKSYAGTRVLGGVSLLVPSGELAVLEGPNGAGKTTLLEIIAGTVAADSGEVRLGGRQAEGVPPEERGVFYIPQTLHKFWSMRHEKRYGFIPDRTVRDNLLAAVSGHGEADWSEGSGLKEVEEWSARLGLSELSGRIPNQLSLGLQQRVALARAILTRPGILLLDEGLSALDKAMRAAALGIVREIPGRLGTTVLYVTHHADEALTLGGARFHLQDGELSEATPTASARVRPGPTPPAASGRSAADLRGRLTEEFDRFIAANPGAHPIDGRSGYREDFIDFVIRRMRQARDLGVPLEDFALWSKLPAALLEGDDEEVRRRMRAVKPRTADPEPTGFSDFVQGIDL